MPPSKDNLYSLCNGLVCFLGIKSDNQHFTQKFRSIQSASFTKYFSQKWGSLRFLHLGSCDTQLWPGKELLSYKFRSPCLLLWQDCVGKITLVACGKLWCVKRS